MLFIGTQKLIANTYKTMIRQNYHHNLVFGLKTSKIGS